MILKRCLIISGGFYPAYKYGGPVRSLTNLVDLFGGKLDFDIITADRDLGDIKPFDDIVINSWENKYKDCRVCYLSPDYSILSIYNKILKGNSYDFIYINSFFDFKYSGRFIFLYFIGFYRDVKIVLAPRGELSKGALSIKPLKKKIYIYLFKLMGFHKKLMFHFTSNQEKNESCEVLGSVNSYLAPNMHSVIPPYQRKIKIPGSLNLIFLSRISPKKNLLLVLETLSKVKLGNVKFTIAGPIEDKLYWGQCLDKIKKIPQNVSVSILGGLSRDQVTTELNKSHVYFLPTLNENYGHAIVEAMINSNIVILSDQTPWSDVRLCGGVVGNVNQVSLYLKAIEDFIEMDSDTYNNHTHMIYKYSNSILKNNVLLIEDMFK